MDYFGEDTNQLQMHPNCCDNCQKGLSNMKLSDLYVGFNDQDEYDFTRNAKTLINGIKCMEMCNVAATRKNITDLLMGKGGAELMKLPQFGVGVGHGRSAQYWGTFIDQLMYYDYIDFRAGESKLTLSQKGESWRNENESTKILLLKPVGAIFQFIERKPLARLAITESPEHDYEHQRYSRHQTSHSDIIDMLFGPCAHCG